MNNKLFVLGSINVDLNITTEKIPMKGETVKGSDYFEVPGGKGANQAVTASILGTKTFMIGAIGEDRYGEFALNNLKKFNINVSYIQKEKISTGIAFIIKNQNDNRIIINPGANESVDEKNIIECLKNSKKNDYFLTQLENDSDVVLNSLKKAKDLGLITTFNPAPAKKIDEKFYRYIDYLIMNESEASLLGGVDLVSKENSLEIGRRFIERGVKNCIITLGEEGCVLVNEKEELIIDANKVEVIDTTGAGDSFIGAFISEKIKGKNNEESLKYATKVSAYICTVDGAQSEKLGEKFIMEEYNEEKNHN